MTSNTRLLVSAFCAGLGMWITAGLWHNLVLPHLYEEVHPHHEGLGLMFVAYLILAFLMSVIYSWTRKSAMPVVDGLKVGVLIGILWVFPHGLAMAGAHGTSVLYEVKNALWHIAEQGIGGVIIAFVFGKTGEKRNA